MAQDQVESDGGPTSDAPAHVDVHPYLEVYVARLKESGVLRDPAVERAFRRMPRDLFVGRFFVRDQEQGWTPVDHDPTHPRPEHLETIYSDAALITRLDGSQATSSASQPGLVADMLQLLALRPGLRVLEIGAGTGYNAALLAELVDDPARVVTLDIQEDVVAEARRNLARAGFEEVRVLCRDGFAGAPEAAPFDRIVATVGCPDLSPRWLDQLAPAGFLLVPLRHAGANPLVRAWRDGDDISGRIVGFSGFMPIQGTLGGEGDLDLAPSRRDAVEEERPVWPEVATASSRGEVVEVEEARLAFWFFLGLRDRRARLFRWLSSFGLDDKPSGRTARLEGDRLVGDPALLDELDAGYREWRALGAPAMTRFRLRFFPHHSSGRRAVSRSEEGQAAERSWTVPGPFFWREFSLAREQPAPTGQTLP